MQENTELLQKYTTEVKSIKNRKGAWDSLLVEIFLKEKHVGSYTRNYPSLNRTFYPFVQDDQEYALYSTDYTATRVMTLPDCKDLCGEERDPWGFCPTGYAVPWFKYDIKIKNPDDPKPYNPRHDPNKWATKEYIAGTLTYKWPEGENTEYKKACKESDDLHASWYSRNPYIEKEFNSQFGFVCGCIWGDDTSWKIQFLDLSKIKEGRLTRSEKFGYIELVGNLADSIELEPYDPEEPYIRIACSRRFDLRLNY